MYLTESIAILKAVIAERDARIADLETALGQSDGDLGVAFKLPTSLAKLLGCLMATPNVTPEMVTLRLNIATDAKVAIHRLKRALRAPPDDPSKPIEIKARRGLGYWLEPADKERVKAITRGVTTLPPQAAAPNAAIEEAA